MTRFHVDPEAVLSATTAAQGTIGRIQAEVAGLHGQLTQLQGSWSGTAAEAFQTVVTEWRSTQQRVEEALSSIATALGQAARHYNDIEAANLRLFTG